MGFIQFEIETMIESVEEKITKDDNVEKEPFFPAHITVTFMLKAIFLGCCICGFFVFIIYDFLDLCNVANLHLPPVTEFPSLLPSMCKLDHDARYVEDMAIHEPSGYVFMSAERERFQWYPPFLKFNWNVTRNGYISVHDVMSKKTTRLKIKSKTMKSFHPHGIDIYQDPEDKNHIYLFVINHRAREEDYRWSLYSVVERFEYRIGYSYLTHLETIENSLIWTPNDIAAVSPTNFYVSNDHFFRAGILRYIEDFFRLPLSWVSYYTDESKSLKVVSVGYRTATGNAVSKNGKYYYQASMMTGTVIKFKINHYDGTLMYMKTLPVGMLVDSVSFGQNGTLMATGHPRGMDLINLTTRRMTVSGSQVIGFDLAENKKSLIASSPGMLISGSTTTVYHKKSHVMLIGGVLEGRGFLRCSGKGKNIERTIDAPAGMEENYTFRDQNEMEEFLNEKRIETRVEKQEL